MKKIMATIDTQTREELIQSMKEFNCFVIFVKDDKMIHSVGYESIPKVKSLIHLFEELKTDEEFGIPDLEELKIDIIGKQEWLIELLD